MNIQSENAAAKLTVVASLSRHLPLVGCSVFLILLLVVNLIRSDLDPTWHFISEYEIGPLGWMMQLAFLSFGAAHFALARSIARTAGGLLGRFSLLLLLVAGIGLLLGGLFRADSMATPAGLTTTSGMIHNIGGALGLAMPFAAICLTKLLRRDEAWRGFAILLPLAIVAVAASLITIIVFAAYLSGSNGVVEPGMPLGIFNRLEIIAYAGWFLTVAVGPKRQLADR